MACTAMVQAVGDRSFFASKMAPDCGRLVNEAYHRLELELGAGSVSVKVGNVNGI